MPLHTEQLNTLQSHLTGLAVAARQMLAVLMQEYDTLYAGDIPLPDLLSEKAQLAGKLEDGKEAFTTFRATLDVDDMDAELKQLDDPSHLAQWKETISLLQQCDRHNELNGRLLNRMNVRNRLFSRIMSNQVTDPTYSRKGQMDEGRQGILGKA